MYKTNLFTNSDFGSNSGYIEFAVRGLATGSVYYQEISDLYWR